MNKNELKKLKRSELLEMLLDRSKEVEHLRNYLEDANRRVHECEKQLQQVGMIDDAIERLDEVIRQAETVVGQVEDKKCLRRSGAKED